MRHIISVLMQNEAGALARLSGMFSSRGYNIESLSVAPTDEPSMSRLTLVTSGDDAVIDQITKQLNQLNDIVEIDDFSGKDHIECELLLIKLEVTASNARSVIECVRRYRGLVLDESQQTRTVQVSGSGLEVSDFVAEVGKLTKILELVRSGVAAIEAGAHGMRSPDTQAA